MQLPSACGLSTCPLKRTTEIGWIPGSSVEWNIARNFHFKIVVHISQNIDKALGGEIRKGRGGSGSIML